MSKAIRAAEAAAAKSTPGNSKNSSKAALASATLVTVRAKPGARQSQVTAVNDDAVDIQIAAPPREGEANKCLVEFVADTVGVRKGSVSLASGHRSRDKVLRVENVSPDEVERLLRQNIKS
ncbi:hypothetical protein RI367_007372 [Sorochytrium milnesiophthora]